MFNFFSPVSCVHLLTVGLIAAILTVLHAVTPPGCGDTLGLGFT